MEAKEAGVATCFVLSCCSVCNLESLAKYKCIMEEFCGCFKNCATSCDYSGGTSDNAQTDVITDALVEKPFKETQTDAIKDALVKQCTEETPTWPPSGGTSSSVMSLGLIVVSVLLNGFSILEL
jgi:hypothetical protein